MLVKRDVSRYLAIYELYGTEASFEEFLYSLTSHNIIPVLTYDTFLTYYKKHLK